jgi:hypothetical protein
VFFVKARLHWITRSQADANVIVTAMLRAHPDFYSMKILLASMNIEDHNFPAATKMLDEVATAHPEDLWLFMDRPSSRKAGCDAGAACSPGTG